MTEVATADDGLPLVGEDQGNRSLWLGLGGIGIAGLLLFATLEANRQTSAGLQIATPSDYATASAPQPGLAIPENYWSEPNSHMQRPDTGQNPGGSIAPFRPPPVRLTATQLPSSASRAPALDTGSAYTPTPVIAAPAPPDPGRSAPVIVHDIAAALVAAVTGSETAALSAPAVAAAAVDRSNLVPQGTLIYAVLETALNSTQAGQVRAMISNDVYNAAGTKILIAKGARVFGEYKGELAAGQNRAQIIWGRLIRPDGVTISLDSPASDQLGRAGVKGRVNTHFGERLLGALLQSTIDFGAYAASRAVTSNNGVVIALPTSAQSAGSQILPEVPKPTLKVRHGTRIAVFVSRDLDFSAVE